MNKKSPYLLPFDYKSDEIIDILEKTCAIIETKHKKRNLLIQGIEILYEDLVNDGFIVKSDSSPEKTLSSRLAVGQ